MRPSSVNQAVAGKKAPQNAQEFERFTKNL
jgi:hypothetical protein